MANALLAAGHEEVEQSLLEKGADVNAEGREYGNALPAASDRGHKEVGATITSKTRPNVHAEGGEKLRQRAVRSVVPLLVQFLLHRKRSQRQMPKALAAIVVRS